MKKKILRQLIKICVFLACFILSMVVASKVLNKGTTDMTQQMKKASLPVVYSGVNDEYINCMQGYINDMEGNYLRGPITPMSADRTIPIKIKTFDTVVTKVSYEVRTLDMERLLENVDLPSFEYSDNEILATVPVKDLIKDEKEYMLVIKLELSDGRVARYYCRFIDEAELYLNDKISFVRDFSQSTFDKEKAKEINKYMESNSEGDNTSFSYVNIHSNFEQLTWGNLKPMVVGDKELKILDISSDDGSFLLEYSIKAKGEEYKVREYFYIMRGSKRMYLMDYERTMDQIFDDDNVVIANGKVFHGILSEGIENLENEDATVYCFAQGNRLYSYNSNSGTLARIYSAWDRDNDDIRTRKNSGNIRILSVDETGNVYFAVYGYIPRGNHEGEVGILVYYYDSVYNTIEEQMFVPYYKSYEILKHDVEQLCYINRRGTLYLMFNGTIYDINIESKRADIIASGLNETRFVSSEDNSMIAWQPEEELYKYKTLKYMSLDAMSASEIKADDSHILIPLGFFNKDFVYGTVMMDDIRLDSTGRTILPMDAIYIQNLSGDILKRYNYEGIYVTDGEFRDNMLNLERMAIDSETGVFYKIKDDQIMNNEDKELNQNAYKSVVTEDMETTWQTVLKNPPKEDKVNILTPKEIIFEEDREFALNVKDIRERYYVYSKGQVVDIYTDVAEAVFEAGELSGIVVNKECSYIWEFNNTPTRASIEGIEPKKVEKPEEYAEASISNDKALPYKTTLSLCLEAMLENAGVFFEEGFSIASSDSAISILDNYIEKGEALELTGCMTDTMLYYVGKGIPVMAMVDNSNAVLIVGYDSKNISIYDPSIGQIYSKSTREATTMFSNGGNRFVAYHIND